MKRNAKRDMIKIKISVQLVKLSNGCQSKCQASIPSTRFVLQFAHLISIEISEKHPILIVCIFLWFLYCFSVFFSLLLCSVVFFNVSTFSLMCFSLFKLHGRPHLQVCHGDNLTIDTAYNLPPWTI